jgi:hypothetical protein
VRTVWVAQPSAVAISQPALTRGELSNSQRVYPTELASASGIHTNSSEPTQRRLSNPRTHTPCRGIAYGSRIRTECVPSWRWRWCR